MTTTTHLFSPTLSCRDGVTLRTQVHEGLGHMLRVMNDRCSPVNGKVDLSTLPTSRLTLTMTYDT